jgi:hypothetical protein
MCVCESTYAVLLSSAFVFLNLGLVEVLFLGSLDSGIAMIMQCWLSELQNFHKKFRHQRVFAV